MSKSQQLAAILHRIGDAAIAVSGGVDSMTLASFAHAQGLEPLMVHGLSSAVPAAATERVKAAAKAQGWNLQIVDAGEFGDPNYRANPVNRCYFCKSNLYATVQSLAKGTILSGANKDDLSDYRPGLDAATEHRVRHPYIEAEMTKPDVRQLAADLGLGEIAELPSSPCLASRVETGIAIDAQTLRTIDKTEAWLRERYPQAIIRCRFRHTGWVIELDETTLATIERENLASAVRRAMPAIAASAVLIQPYRRGSAFLHSHPN